MIKSFSQFCFFNFFIFFGNFCFSETQLGLGSFTIDTNSEIKIASDSMMFDSKTQLTEFVDNVVIKFGDLTLESATLKILHPSKSSPNNFLEFYMDGPLVISDGENFIHGDTAFYSRKNQEITISGNVNLEQGNNNVSGDKLILNLNNGLAKIIGSVKTVLEPIGNE